MSEAELSWLAEQASVHERIVEIGSWRGRSTVAMAMHTKGTVFAVDTWDCNAYGWPGWWSGPENTRLMQQPDWLFTEFLNNITGLRVMTFRMLSLTAAQLLGDQKFDMIFIDADHEEVGVWSDIMAWRPLLAKDGLFCGHDYGYAGWPAVERVVKKLVPRHEVVDTIWYAV